MNVSIQAVKFNLDEDQKEFIDKKLERVSYAKDLVTDLILTIKLENQKFYFDCTINFRWGANAHVKNEDYDFTPGVNKLMDILDQKINKEKEKIQDKTR